MHGRRPSALETTFSKELIAAYKNNTPTKNREIFREVGGYGQVSESDLFRSSDHCVVLTSEEEIERDSTQFFELPLPASFLRSALATRELSVTLAYSPAVRTARHDAWLTNIALSRFAEAEGYSLRSRPAK